MLTPAAPIDRWSLPAAHGLKSNEVAEDTGPETDPTFQDSQVLVLATVLEIIGVMMLSSALIALFVFSRPLAILGFCVAFLLMLFIGLPLILASIADATEAH